MVFPSGDAVDKGAGDIRVVKTLLSLKQRYGSRAPWRTVHSQPKELDGLPSGNFPSGKLT